MNGSLTFLYEFIFFLSTLAVTEHVGEYEHGAEREYESMLSSTNMLSKHAPRHGQSRARRVRKWVCCRRDKHVVDDAHIVENEYALDAYDMAI